VMHDAVRHLWLLSDDQMDLPDDYRAFGRMTSKRLAERRG